MTILLMIRVQKGTLHSHVFIDSLTRPVIRKRLYDDQSHFDHRDLQPEMYICEPRENVEFDNFEDSVKLSEKFKKSLCTFEDVDKEDSFFYTILFGLLTKLSNNGSFNEQPTAEILGEEFAKKLPSEKENFRLDDCHESFFDKCHMVNELIEEKGVFLRVYERKDKFRFLIKKGVSGKNKVLRDLSSCIIRKLNGY